MAELMPTIVYTLCFLTSVGCALLLVQGYRRSQARMLLWSAFSFVLLAASNLLVMIDLAVLQDTTSLQLPRLILSFGAVAVLLFGFIWDLED